MNDLLLPVVVVHGIGSGENKDRAGFSTVLSRNVDEVSRPVTRVGPFEEVAKINAINDPKNSDGIYWQEALWESENNTADAVIEFITDRFSLPGWLTKNAIDLLTDVPLYMGVNGKKIRKAVRDVIKLHPNCIVVGHSLGSVIAADVLQEERLKGGVNKLPVSALITLGSPLNLLGMRNKMEKAFPFKWHNYYYPSDPIAIKGGLKPADFPGVKNHKLNAGETFAVSHTSYWSSTVLAFSVYKLTVMG